MKTPASMWRTFNRVGKIGIIGGFIGCAVGIFVPVIVILASTGSLESKVFGLALTLGLSAVVIGVFVFAFGRVFGPVARQQALQRTGIAAEATVIGLKETGLTVNRIYPVVKIQLRVRPSGGQPYQAEVKTVIGRLDIPQIQPGTTVKVIYDPSNPSDVALAPPADATFTSGDPGGLTPAADGEAARTEQARAMEEFLRENDAICREIRATGQLAPAIIVQAMPLNALLNSSNSAVNFIVEVKPEGRPAFRAQVAGVIAKTSLHNYRPGMTVYVKFDPSDHTRVSLDYP